MPTTLQELRARVAELEARIEEELAEARARFRYRIDRGRAVFDQDIRARHRAARMQLATFLRNARPLVVLTAPVIYALIVPLVLLDLMVSLYQAVCFPVYRIEKVRRRDHIVIDRQWLAYLNALEKLNCVYCAYANGLISYVREIAARTEAYWCPIKHARRARGVHDLHADFVDYGDAEGWRKRMDELRQAGQGRDRSA